MALNSTDLVTLAKNYEGITHAHKCTIKIFRGGGVVDGEGGSSEGCLKWGVGGSLRDLSKNI